jgi:hypothetical protein
VPLASTEEAFVDTAGSAMSVEDSERVLSDWSGHESTVSNFLAARRFPLDLEIPKV